MATVRDIDNIEIIELLGQGGMSLVYKAQQKQLDRIVAVKVLSNLQSCGEDEKRRFQKEAKLTSTLDHANIVKIISFGVSKSNQPYLVMEYLEGQSLADDLKQNGRLKLQKFKDVFVPALFALANAHEHGIVHRDIKPGNIMLCRSDTAADTVKLVDFGIAKVFSEGASGNAGLTKTGAMLGSPAYMSPEQCLGKPVDGRSDLYSMACVMYECLCGELPFKAESVVELMRKQGLESPPTVREMQGKIEINDNLAQVILAGLAKDPDLRPQTGLDFASKLNAALEGSSLDSVPRLSGEKAESVSRKLLLALIVLLFFCIPAAFKIFSLCPQSSGRKTNLSHPEIMTTDKQRSHLRELSARIRSKFQAGDIGRSELLCRNTIEAMGNPDYQPGPEEELENLSVLKTIAKIYDGLGVSAFPSDKVTRFSRAMDKINSASRLSGAAKAGLRISLARIYFFYGECSQGASFYLSACRLFCEEKKFAEVETLVSELKAKAAQSKQEKSMLLCYAYLAEGELAAAKEQNRQAVLCIKQVRQILPQACGDSFWLRKDFLIALFHLQQTIGDSAAGDTLQEIESIAQRSIGNHSSLENLGIHKHSPYDDQIRVLDELQDACQNEEFQRQVGPLLRAARENKNKYRF